ncbi:hypothetical protein EVAR_2930_1 [Eumeta japonica]|uniref:Uncharacterized protein n=1 Tax=Eumeta variegata TaxID=151549 RepID=A0A4C1T109_EUMVA|nr:hypothetical protein EVAR_2930_1 [Eumeta japonica]
MELKNENEKSPSSAILFHRTVASAHGRAGGAPLSAAVESRMTNGRYLRRRHSPYRAINSLIEQRAHISSVWPATSARAELFSLENPQIYSLKCTENVIFHDETFNRKYLGIGRAKWSMYLPRCRDGPALAANPPTPSWNSPALFIHET